MGVKGYGLTETTTGVFRFHGEEASQRIGSVGRLVWGCEAKIVDSGIGIALPPGARGELWIRGPLIMQGKQLYFHFSVCVCLILY